MPELQKSLDFPRIDSAKYYPDRGIYIIDGSFSQDERFRYAVRVPLDEVIAIREVAGNFAELYAFGNRKYEPGVGSIIIKNGGVIHLILPSQRKIESLSPAIARLSRLEYLLLFGTEVKHLPKELGKMQNLKYLGVEAKGLDGPSLKLLESLGTLGVSVQTHLEHL